MADAARLLAAVHRLVNALYAAGREREFRRELAAVEAAIAALLNEESE